MLCSATFCNVELRALDASGLCSRHGRVYRYHVCPHQSVGSCRGVRVAAGDIEDFVLRHLEPFLRRDLSGPDLQQAIERI
jgi:hypothetical protein